MSSTRMELNDNVWVEERKEHPNGTVIFITLDDDYDPEEVRILFSNGDTEAYSAEDFYWTSKFGGIWQRFSD